jgi:DNA-directed RNA polymerase specialized sigma24 family protein
LVILEENDPLLHPLIAAGTPEAREQAIESVSARAYDVAHRVVRRFHGQLDREDVADVVSTVLLRVVRRLRDLTGPAAAGSIRSLDDFVATLTYNASYDFMRRKSPERTRHKNRLRYVLMHDERLAMWNGTAGPMTGLAQWRGVADGPSNFVLTRDDATNRMLDRNAIADALTEIFEWNGQPVLLNDLARVTADLWLVAEQEFVDISLAADTGPDPTIQIEQRQYLDHLWSEVCELRAPQRTALMLNLRDSDGLNAVSLLILTGVATFDDVAAALEMEPARLAELWPQLPMNDLNIAGMLGVNRQQVINLRRSARERLSRRMNTKSLGWQ